MILRKCYELTLTPIPCHLWVAQVTCSLESPSLSLLTNILAPPMNTWFRGDKGTHTLPICSD